MCTETSNENGDVVIEKKLEKKLNYDEIKLRNCIKILLKTIHKNDKKGRKYLFKNLDRKSDMMKWIFGNYTIEQLYLILNKTSNKIKELVEEIRVLKEAIKNYEESK